MVKCKKCSMAFDTGPEVGDHVKVVHAKTTKVESSWVPYRCFACPVSFYTHTELSEHRMEHHKMKNSSATFWVFYHSKYGDIA